MAARDVRTRPAKTPATRLARWMDDVVRLRARARHAFDEQLIHDLRVALRRCRTVAQAMYAEHPRRRWRTIGRRATRLLHALGDLRDAQVLQTLAERTAPRGGRLRDAVLRDLREVGDARHKRRMARVLDDFDAARWRRLARRVEKDRALRELGRERARRIVLRKWIDAADAHEAAIAANDPDAWHAARIAWKKLRYSIEAFAPDLHKRWDADVAALQTSLGEVHDLDALAETARRKAGRRNRTELARWLAVIDTNRTTQIAYYGRLTRGTRAAWRTWGAGLAGAPRATS